MIAESREHETTPTGFEPVLPKESDFESDALTTPPQRQAFLVGWCACYRNYNDI